MLLNIGHVDTSICEIFLQQFFYKLKNQKTPINLIITFRVYLFKLFWDSSFRDKDTFNGVCILSPPPNKIFNKIKPKLLMVFVT